MTVLQGVPLDEINAQARDIQFARTVLTIIAAVLFGLGWTAAKVVRGVLVAMRVLVVAAKWCAAAVKVGWRQGWAADPSPAAR